MKFLDHLDLSKSELRNAAIQVLASAPASPVLGQVYFDSVSFQTLFWNGSSWASNATNSALLNGNNSAYLLSRANHTGTQTSSTISDLASVVKAYRLNEFAAPTANISMNGYKLTSIATPTTTGDAATYDWVIAQIQSSATGISVKTSVRVVAQSNITLSGLQTIDGVSLSNGNRVLLVAQTNPVNNGVYIASSGSWTRSTEEDTNSEMKGAFWLVNEGTVGIRTQWIVNNTTNPIVGTDAITIVQFGSSATIHTANGGVTLTGANFSLSTMPANTFKGNNTGSTAAPVDMTATQATALLDLATGSVKGLMSSSDFTKLAGISGTNTGDQTTVSGNAGSATILATGRTLGITGDLVWTSPSFNGSANVTAAGTIQANVVDNTKLAQIATQTFKGRTTAGTGNVEDLTLAQVRTLLSLSGTNTGDQTITLTGDITGSGTGSFAATLATVNSNTGAFGSTTAVPIITVNGKGLVTAVSTATLGSAAVANTGTSGANIPFLNGNNIWSGTATFNSTVALSADPVSSMQAATKQYVDNVAQGLSPKMGVRVATTGNITLSGEQTIDGVLTSNSRVLVKNQTSAPTNGIYISSSGAWSRSTDMDVWEEVAGSYVFVDEGATFADTAWVCTSNLVGSTFGVTNIVWVQFSGAGTYSSGNGLALSGTQFSLASMSANSFKGNNTGSSAAPIDMTAMQATALLDLASGSVKGLMSSSDFTKLAGISAGAQPGTVTSVSVTTANGVSGSVATSTSTPAITLTLGAITPTTVVASGNISGLNLSGTNTGDQTTITGNAGSATILATGRTLGITGDLVWTSPSFNGSTNVTAAGTIQANVVDNTKLATVATATFKGRTSAGTGNVEDLTIAQAKTLLNLTGTNSGDQTITLTGDITGSGTGSFSTTLATVNSNTGSFGSTTAVPIITVNAKGLITAVSTATLGTAAVANTGTSGANLPFLNGNLTWSGTQLYTSTNTFAAATTSIASINIPHGVAPTSPTNGDVWTTTSGAFVRINAATKAFAFTDSNITGSAATLTTGRTIAMTGDLTWTSPTFDGSANVTAAGTLATVNSNVGAFGSATAAPTFTVNGKGLITAAGSVTITPAFASITSKPTTLSGYGITDATTKYNQNIGDGSSTSIVVTHNLGTKDITVSIREVATDASVGTSWTATTTNTVTFTFTTAPTSSALRVTIIA